MKKISLIIPIFNSEKYLKRTLNCLLKQTIISDLEIILVNDGSVDNTGIIIENYRKKFELKNAAYKYIYQANNGVSVARNTGLRAVTSEYTCFMDADDIVDYNYYEKLYYLVKKTKSDIGVGGFQFVHRDGSTSIPKKIIATEYNSKKCLKDFLMGGVVGNNVVDKIFRSESINNIFFSKNKKIGEDMYFVFEAILKSKTISIDTSINGYYYCYNFESAMNRDFDERFFDTITLSEKMILDLKNDNKIIKIAKAHYIHEVCKVIEYMIITDKENRYFEKKKELHNILKTYSNVSAFFHMKFKKFCGFILMKYSERMFKFIYKKMKMGM